MTWAAIGVSVVGGAVSAYAASKASQKQQFTPSGPFLALQNEIMQGIRAGIEAGGYTFSDAVAAQLKREAQFQVDSQFKGAAQKTTAALTPFGNVTAAGRGLSAINTGRALATSQAQNNVDIQQELQKQKSLQGLLQLGAGMQDPTLPAFKASNQFPTQGAVNANALGQGVSTGINLYQAQQPLFPTQNQGQIYTALLPNSPVQPQLNPALNKGNTNKPLF